MAGKSLIPIEVVLSANTQDFKAQLNSLLGGFESQVVSAAQQTKRPGQSAAQRVAVQQGYEERSIVEAQKAGLPPGKAAAELAAVRKSFSEMFERIQASLSQMRPEAIAGIGSARVYPDVVSRVRESDAAGRYARQAINQQAAAESAAEARRQQAVRQAERENVFERRIGGDRLLNQGELKGFRGLLGADGKPMRPEMASRTADLGEGDALNRLFGLFVRINKELAQWEEPLREIVGQARATADGLIHRRRLFEGAASAVRINEDLNGSPEIRELAVDYERERGRLATTRRGIRTEATSGQDDIDRRAEVVADEQRQQRQIRQGVAERQTPEDAADKGRLAAQEKLNTAMARLAEAVELATSPFSDLRAHAEGVAKALEAQHGVVVKATAAEARVAGLGDADIRDASVRAARAKGAEKIAQGHIDLEGTAGQVDAAADLKAEQDRRRRDIDLAAAKSQTPADAAVKSETRVLRDQQNTELNKQLAIERRSTDNTEKIAAAQNEAIRTRRAINQAQVRQFGPELMQGGTWWQRLQAGIANRQGAEPRFATDFQTGGQFLKSKAITSAGFGLTGGLLYGGLALGKDIFRETTELQTELAVVRTQFESVKNTADGVTFERFRNELHKTAADTGVEANEVANVERQLAGAFADKNGPNFQRAMTEGRTALQYSKISGLPQQEITDSLTAVSLAFKDIDSNKPMAFDEILDTITDLENRFGVLGPQLVKFTADIAPLGKELGFTQEQIAGIGAVAQSRSGKSGDVLSEQFGRILPSIQDKAADLYSLYSANPATALKADKLAEALGAGEIDKALAIIVDGYKKLGTKQQGALIDMLGGRREAAAFAALVQDPDRTLEVLEGKSATAEGSYKKRWDEYKKTITASLTEMRRKVEEFGQKLLDSGLIDMLKGAADAGTVLLGVFSEILGVVEGLNSASAGWLGRLAGMGVAAAALAKVSSSLGAIKALQTGAGAVAPAGAIGQRLASVSAAYRGYGVTGGLPGPPVPGADPGVTGKMRAAGKAAVAGLGPAMAAVAVTELGFAVKGYFDGLKTGTEGLAEGIDKQINAGLSDKEIMNKAESGLGHTNPILDATSFVLSGQSQNDVVRDRVRSEIARRRANAEAGRNKARLDALIDNADEIGFAEKKPPPKPSFIEQAMRPQTLPQAITGLFSSDDTAKGPRVATGQTVKQKIAALQKLQKQLEDDPTNVGYKKRIDALVREAKGNKDLAAALKQADVDYAADQKAAEESDAASQEFLDFKDSVERENVAYERGRSSAGKLRKIFEKKRKELEVIIWNAVKAKKFALAAEQQGFLDELNKMSGSDTASKASQVMQQQMNVAEIRFGSGTVEYAQAGLDAAKQKLDTLRKDRGTSIEERAAAAVEVVQAQKALIQQKIDAATDPNEINRLVAQKIEVDPSVRGEIIAQNLNSGELASLINRIVAFFGITRDQAVKIVTDAIISGKNINKALKEVAAAGVRAQLEAARNAIKTQVVGKDISLAGMEHNIEVKKELEKELAGIEEQINGLDTNSIDPGATVSGKAPEGKDPKDEAKDIAAARREYLLALAGDDPVAAAQQALANARAEVAEADGPAARFRALANEISAERGLRDAINAFYDAQTDVAVALAEQAGDTVEVARLQMAAAQAKLDRARAGGAGDTELAQLEAEAIRTQTNMTTTMREDRMADLDYMYEFDKITANEYIKELRLELLKIPESNKKARYDIERKIKGLREEMSSNAMMNIPAEIQLPTLYESRRLNQQGSYLSSNTYNDNRTVQIVVNEAGDVRRTVAAVSETLNAAPRSGLATTGEWI